MNIMSGYEDDSGIAEVPEEEEKLTDERREFNPMVTWFYMCVAIGSVYGVGYIGGFPLMILVTVFLMIWMVWKHVISQGNYC